ncbi:hypothetical protein B0H14DRAFT_2564952 [Mycena olivaceomarginata]|nr:hypothetical protein B0H14DRAFT_2564952 [Mycena olivaceomarginata]
MIIRDSPRLSASHAGHQKIVYRWQGNTLRCIKKEEGQINLEAPYIKEDISGESRDAYANQWYQEGKICEWYRNLDNMKMRVKICTIQNADQWKRRIASQKHEGLPPDQVV